MNREVEIQLTCIPANLKRALDITVPAALSRATLPILSYVLLETNERGELQVQSSNLQQYADVLKKEKCRGALLAAAYSFTLVSLFS